MSTSHRYSQVDSSIAHLETIAIEEVVTRQGDSHNSGWKFGSVFRFAHLNTECANTHAKPRPLGIDERISKREQTTKSLSISGHYLV